MINTNTTLVSKHQLLDYVSKRDFNNFVAEMHDFRDVTESRFNNIDRKLDKLGDDFRIQVGAVLDQFKENMQINREHIQGIEERLTSRIQALEDKINR